MSKRQTGQDLVRLALEAGESLTGLEAWQRFDVRHLAGVVHTLRHKGMSIDVQMVETPTTGKRIARYRLAGKA